MKGLKYGIWLFMLFALMACGGSSSSSESSRETGTIQLEEGEPVTGFIRTNDDVNTYRIRANDVNRYLNIKCTESTSGSGVDLLVTVYEEVNGKRVRIFGQHKPNGASLSADLDIWIYIDRPKDVIIEVRDFMANNNNGEIPYKLICTFQDSANGNHDFANAKSLTIDSDEVTKDAIDDIGQVDCFTFEPQADGVYSLKVDHQKPGDNSPVQLAVSLYDKDGNSILRVEDPNDTILAYLEEAKGPYNVSVEDSDSLHADAGAPYGISVNTVDVTEAQVNDVIENATLIEIDAQNVYTATGAIDYGSSSIAPDNAGDIDWYRFTVGTVGGSTTYHPLQLNIDDGETVNGSATLRVTVYDSEEKEITYHDFTAGTAVYQNQIRVENGEYYISVETTSSSSFDISTTYQVQLKNLVINDENEVGDKNTADTARPLTNGTPVNGFVSYQSDVDFYSIPVNTSTDNILSVDLKSAETIVDYQVSIWLGDKMIKKVTARNGSDNPSHVKTSILVPADPPGADTTYHIKVGDAQNNEGSGVPYTVQADVTAVAGAPPSRPETTHYYGETTREANETAELELEIFSTLQPHFKVNTEWLDFRSDANKPTYQSPQSDDTTVITFPWISGYVDYQGDRDFFQLDFDKLDPAGTETSWYYDVEIELVVPGPGSDVEYVWKLYNDTNSNGIIIDSPPPAEDGYVACDGDITPLTKEAIQKVTSSAGPEPFWIGSDMGAGAKFYIGISDFNYLILPNSDDTPNTNNDDDWGYQDQAAYYFRLKLTYHPGVSAPSN